MEHDYQKNPVIIEISRQVKQGFAEKKEGNLSSHYSFRINLCDGNSNNLLLQHGNLRYRTSSGQYTEEGYSISRDGHALLGLTFRDYAPFHKIINDIVPIIGEHGEAIASKFDDDEEKWRWELDEDDPKSLKQALRKYRFGYFEYKSPENITLSFSSDGDAQKNIGELLVLFPFEDIRKLELRVVGEVAEYLRRV